MPYNIDAVRRMMNAHSEPEEGQEDMQSERERDPLYPEIKVVWIDADRLQPLPTAQNFFRLADPERLEDLKRNIALNGILNPLIVVPGADSQYDILAGRNRHTAATQLGWRKLPCIVRTDLESVDDQMPVIISDNILHREEILPSERAKSYLELKKILKRRAGRRKDAIGTEESYVSRDLVDMEVSGRNVSRYIRLNELIPELLTKVDGKKLSIGAGETLSYLPMEAQEVVYTYFFVDNPKVHIDKRAAQELRRISTEPGFVLDAQAIDKILKEKEMTKAFRSVKVPMKSIRTLFPSYATPDEVVETVLEATQLYFKGLAMAAAGRETAKE